MYIKNKMYEGDMLCKDCFGERKKSASSVEYQNLLDKNYGLYAIPFYGLGLLALRLKKKLIDHCEDVYHVYINGNHEIWHDDSSDIYSKKNCKNCNNFCSYFYKLVSIN